MLEIIWTGIVSFFQDVGGLFGASTVVEAPQTPGKPSSQPGAQLPQIADKGVARKASYIGRIREAEKLIDHGYFSQAGLELSMAVQEREGLIKPYLLLGDIYVRLSDREKLQTLIQQLEKKFPAHSQIEVLKARKMLLEDDFQGVKNLYANSENPAPQLRLYYAGLLALQNNHTQAREILKELSQLEVREYTLKVGGDGVLEAQQIQDSLLPQNAQAVENIIQSYEQFDIMSEGQTAHLFAMIGKAFGDLSESALMRAFADISLKEESSYIDAWLLRGYSFFIENRFELALQDFHQAYRLDPARPQTHYFLALVLSELGRTGEAIAFFEKSLESDFEFSEELEWKLTDLLVQDQKYDAALKLYERLIDENTQPDRVARAINTIINRAKRPDVAVHITEPLIRTKAQNPFYLNMYGWSLLSDKKLDQAKGVLETALEIQPENAQTLLNLGMVFELKSDYKKARDYYLKSYQIGKENPDFVSIANLSAERYNRIRNK